MPRRIAPPAGGALGHCLVVGLLAAELAPTLAAPWAGVRGLLLATVLALPATLVGSCLVTAVRHMVVRSTSLEWRARAARFAVAGLWGAVVFWLGSAAANLVLVDEPLKPRMLFAYAISCVLALASAALLWDVIEHRNPGQWLRGRSTSSLGMCVALGFAVLSALVDALFLTHGYWSLHVALLGCTLCASVALFSIWLGRQARRAWLITAGLGVGHLLCAGSFARFQVSPYQTVLSAPTSHQRLLLLWRQLTDRDGDGFSAMLGGNDCDDQDPRVFPLSVVGRDCLGWVPRADQAPVPRLSASNDATRARPNLVVFVTLDAFRCGFGRSEIPELLNACPHLTRLGEQGRLRLDAYTIYPHTARAIPALLTLTPGGGEGSADPVWLAQWLSERGWETIGISTIGRELSAAVASSFKVVDRSLDAPAHVRVGATSALVTDRIVETIRSRAPSPAKPLFVWGHYFDAHAPYVETVGSMFSFSSKLHRYVAEIRRVDHEVGRLAEMLRQLPAADTLLIVTADHGEGFGEKGCYYHGSAINDPGVRVPIVVWSPSPRLLPPADAALPTGAAELPTFVAAAATGARFVSTGEAFFQAHVRGGQVFGLYRDGWKITHHQVFGATQLYYLPADPGESHDLSGDNPDKLREMIGRLSRYLRKPRPGLTL
jgi:hypothetical protein